jgi:hypothetical protein
MPTIQHEMNTRVGLIPDERNSILKERMLCGRTAVDQFYAIIGILDRKVRDDGLGKRTLADPVGALEDDEHVRSHNGR